jgi:hypothetical protein
VPFPAASHNPLAHLQARDYAPHVPFHTATTAAPMAVTRSLMPATRQAARPHRARPLAQAHAIRLRSRRMQSKVVISAVSRVKLLHVFLNPMLLQRALC